MRSVVTASMTKAEVSTPLTALMDPPYLRFCRACNATHLYEMPFRQAVRTTRLPGPFDLFLQARDRPILVSDPARAKALWPVLGRPGGVLVVGEIVGLWRPHKSGNSLRVNVEMWTGASSSVRAPITEQAERLAAYRQVPLSGIDLDG